MGGFASTSFWHRVFALITFACFVVYLVPAQSLVLRRPAARRVAAAARSSAPIRRCRRSATSRTSSPCSAGSSAWGRSRRFERWAYWEKFDFWGAAADIVIIGSTGLVLWFPNFFCRFLPGIALNIAQVIHSTQALLATGFVFAIHFFNTHLRPDKFPADMSVMTGLVSEEEFQEDAARLSSSACSARATWTRCARRVPAAAHVADPAGRLAGLVRRGWRCWRA